MANKTLVYHVDDLPDSIKVSEVIAVDTEAMGLNNHRDRLCLVQLSSGDGVVHLIHFKSSSKYSAPNLKRILENDKVLKVFHFARFDVAILQRYLSVEINSIYCTKIASRLARTYTDCHGLKDLCMDLLGIRLSKQQRLSDWGSDTLTPEQLEYASNDVLYLHELREALDIMLAREGRSKIAKKCFESLPTIAYLDLLGWSENIFEH